MATLGNFVSGQALTAAELNAIGTYTTFDPNWTNLSVGNGTQTAEYMRINDLVIYRIEVVFGSTTSISGDVQFDYPVAGGATYTNAVGGQAYFEDATSTDYYGGIYRFSTSTGRVVVFDASGTYNSATFLSATVPFTWTTSDRLLVADWYFL